MRPNLFPILLILLTAGLPIHAMAGAPILPCRVIQTLPHDPHTSTQGLLYLNDRFYESSGGYDHSFLAVVDPDTGRHLLTTRIGPTLFAEGIASCGHLLRMVTWQAGMGFIFSLDSLQKQGEFTYAKPHEQVEGWGLTCDASHFYLSTGSASVRLQDLKTFRQLGTLQVTDNGNAVHMLNELEYVDGWLYANIWKSDRIAIIAPATGNVRAWLDLSSLRLRIAPKSGVANGIAYDNVKKRLFVTGKHWNKMFEIAIPDLR